MYFSECLQKTKAAEFTTLYTQQFPKIVKSLIARYRISSEVAEDIVQNVLTDTWAALTTCDESEVNDILSVSYIYKVCKNHAARYISQCMRYEMIPLDNDDEKEHEKEHGIVNSKVEFEAWKYQVTESAAAALSSHRIKLFMHHLCSLSDKHRELIIRHKFKHESYTVIAESLGFKNTDVCKQLVSRHLNQIRKKVQEDMFTFAA